jgi:hypothetical protein
MKIACGFHKKNPFAAFLRTFAPLLFKPLQVCPLHWNFPRTRVASAGAW